MSGGACPEWPQPCPWSGHSGSAGAPGERDLPPWPRLQQRDPTGQPGTSRRHLRRGLVFLRGVSAKTVSSAVLCAPQLTPTFLLPPSESVSSPTFWFVAGQGLPGESCAPGTSSYPTSLLPCRFLHLSGQKHYEKTDLFISPFPQQICKHQVCEQIVLAKWHPREAVRRRFVCPRGTQPEGCLRAARAPDHLLGIEPQGSSQANTDSRCLWFSNCPGTEHRRSARGWSEAGGGLQAPHQAD